MGTIHLPYDVLQARQITPALRAYSRLFCCPRELSIFHILFTSTRTISFCAVLEIVPMIAPPFHSVRTRIPCMISSTVPTETMYESSSLPWDHFNLFHSGTLIISSTAGHTRRSGRIPSLALIKLRVVRRADGLYSVACCLCPGVSVFRVGSKNIAQIFKACVYGAS